MEMQSLDVNTIGCLSYVIKYPAICADKYPAIIYLHGAGTRGTNIGKLMNHSFFGTSHFGNADTPFILFAPLCSKNSWFDIFEQLQAFVRMVAAHPNVDANRLFLMGSSMGGYGTWQLAMTMPEYFAAIVPICGGGMKWNAERLVHVPVWAFHGADDSTVPVQESILMVDAVKKAGGTARLTILENTGHNSWDYAFSTKELFAWLLAQTRTCESVSSDSKYTDSKLFG